MTLKPMNVPVRFFIWKENEDALEGEDHNDVFECNESEFINSPYPIDYERHTVFQNGVSQICLTKMPQG